MKKTLFANGRILAKAGLTFFAFLSLSAISFSQNVNVTLASRLSYPTQSLSNICGWVDPADNKEYALVGAQDGLSIVDITNPASPFEVIQIPGPSSSWREIKTNGNYAYVTTEQCCNGLQIVDLTNLPGTNLAVTTWEPALLGDTLGRIHALHIDNNRVYLYGTQLGNKGAIIADIGTNPMAPVYLGKYDPRYVHDGYVRNDTLYAGHIYDGEVAVVNCANATSPTILATFKTPTVFTHNTWLSKNSKFLFTTDENSNSYIGAFDVSNLSNIFETDRIQTNPGSGSIVHNTHIITKNNIDYAVTSWYTEGFTITDVSRPNNMVQVGNYDTYTASATGFNGCWGVYPFFPSGTIVASDIDSGLFVFSPTYVPGCYLEGVVKDCSTGVVVSGATVALQITNPQSTSYTDITDFQGQYAVGIQQAGTYSVTVSKVGFISLTTTVTLTPGVVNNYTFQLCPKQLFSYTGKIFDNATLAGIPSAKVSVYDSGSRWDTITDANGNFTIPNIFSGTYNVAAGKWGYFTQCFSGQNLSATSGGLNLGLDKGIYDDFMWDFGWTVSGNATTGIWERGEPQGTFSQGNPVNPDVDVVYDCGDEAYVTGNQGVSSTDDDVDGGTTILTSPVFDLTGYVKPMVFYSRWRRLSVNSADTIHITMSNGSTTATLEALQTSASTPSWVPRSYLISSYLTPTSTMTFRMQVSDYGSDNTNEGGLDKFYILDSADNNSVSEVAHKVEVLVFPNPFRDKVVVQMLNAHPGVYILNLYDVYGRLVGTERSDAGSDNFVIERNELKAGVYFYHVMDGNAAVSSGKVCVE